MARWSFQDDGCGMTSALFSKEDLHLLLPRARSLMKSLCRCNGTRVAIVFEKVLEGTGERDGVEVVKDVCWEKLHTGHWKDVREEWRDAYALAQCLSVYEKLCGKSEEEGDWEEEMKELDLALVMGGDLFRSDLETILRRLGNASKKRKGPSGDIAVPKKQKIADDALPLHALQPSSGRSLFCWKSVPSIEEFSRRCLSTDSEPCLLKGLVRNWPAFEKWHDVEYFHSRFGYRTVPIEIGRHYLADKWGQELMTFTEFLTKHVCHDSPTEQTGYLAQHPLFDQIPELKRDIYVPEYCYLNASDNEPVINVWFGPKGTVSPLHYDRSQNILTQVVGRKYVRLYAPSQSAALLPFPTFMNRNSSRIDLDDEEQVKSLGIDKLEFVDLILESGDGLFIPRGWWHYVRSLELSFSVSFWWNAQEDDR